MAAYANMLKGTNGWNSKALSVKRPVRNYRYKIYNAGIRMRQEARNKLNTSKTDAQAFASL